MSDLNALVVFAKVAETMSFSEAAKRLAMPVSTVSRKIADLEQDLGVRLLERSTRRLRLTDIGADVLREAQRGAEVSEAVARIVSDQRTNVSGLLRLSAPPSIADSLVSPIVSAFQTVYPDLRIHVLVTDRFVDHISEGIDIAFRVGALRDSTLIAKNMLTYRRQLVASPDYLAKHLPPQHPNELLHHRLLAFSSWTNEHQWTFQMGAHSKTVQFVPHLAMNDYSGLAEAMASGNGIGELPPIVRPELLRTGRLIEIMPDWKLSAEPLSMVYLGNRYAPRPLLLFKDFAAEFAPTLFRNLPL